MTKVRVCINAEDAHPLEHSTRLGVAMRRRDEAEDRNEWQDRSGLNLQGQ
jgi:hypothetical protein